VSNIDLWQIMASDNSFRVGVATEAERKAAQGSGPVYMYYFRWKSAVREGKLKCYHCLDIPFAFDNVEVATSMTGTSQTRYALATKMSAAFANFARTGNPNAEGLPNWPAFDLQSRATMFLDNECEVVNDPHREERLTLAKLRDAADSAGGVSS
jgi:para-nitrobenzyl esterase